jgi:hypothetical protein
MKHFAVICAICNSELEVYTTDRGVIVEPCEECCEKQYSYGRLDGYDEGWDERDSNGAT